MINLEEIKLLNEDVYGASRKLESFFINIQSVSIHPESRKKLVNFLKDFLAKGNNSVRVLKYAYALEALALFFPNKPLSEVTSVELKRLLLKLQVCGSDKSWRRDLLVSFALYYNYCKSKERIQESVVNVIRV